MNMNLNSAWASAISAGLTDAHEEITDAHEGIAHAQEVRGFCRRALWGIWDFIAEHLRFLRLVCADPHEAIADAHQVRGHLRSQRLQYPLIQELNHGRIPNMI